MELKITDKHPQMRDTLKEVFPEAFPSEYLEFKEAQKLNSYRFSDGIVIGLGLAPLHLKGKCLIWRKNFFEAEVGTTEYGLGYIAFKKLK